MTAEHDQLPLPDFDHLPVGTLASHLSALTEEQLGVLFDYERAHGGRLPVLQILEHRMEALRSGERPTGEPPEFYPELGGEAGRSAVGEASGEPERSNPAPEHPPVNRPFPR